MASEVKVPDLVLQNAWGVAFTPAASPFWISDNATGCATLYDGEGAKVAVTVAIPLPGNVIPNSACKHVDPNNPPSQTPVAATASDKAIAAHTEAIHRRCGEGPD